jgi:hypothetical protein
MIPAFSQGPLIGSTASAGTSKTEGELSTEHLQIDGLMDELASAQRHGVCIRALASRIIGETSIRLSWAC